jgi:hypothetical protein
MDRGFSDPSLIVQLPRLAWFGVWFRLPAGEGFWNTAEDEALDAVERALLELASQRANGWAVYVRSLSTTGIREYYLYAAAHVEFSQVLLQLKARFPEYRLEYEHRDDPGWSLYQQWLNEPATPLT